MSDINRVVMIGRLVRDVELRYTQGRSSVASLSLAVGYTYGSGADKKEQTSFFNCVAWGKLAEIMAQYCKKGQRIGIDGRLQQRSWEDKDGKKQYAVEIVVEHMEMLTPKTAEQALAEEPGQKANAASSSPDFLAPNEEDIPF